LRAIKLRPCRLRGVDGAGDCRGVVQAAHAGDVGVRALSRRSGTDRDCVPLCADHHYDRDNRRGYFEGMDVLDLRAWSDAAIADELERYLRQQAGESSIPF
jgi:hypothetical protein